MNRERPDLSDAVLLALTLLLFLLASTMSYEDEVAEAEHYCERVGLCVWPDFNPEVNCEE